MKILISGVCGKMGKAVESLALSGCQGVKSVHGVDFFADGSAKCPCATSFDGANFRVDCVVDFSHHRATEFLLSFVEKHGLPVVIGTTGHTPVEREMIRRTAEKVPVYFAPNCSLGVALMERLVKEVAAFLPEAEVEILEMHHGEKADAPSGTALALAETVRSVKKGAKVVVGRSGNKKRTPGEIGVHALRLGALCGTHEVLFATPYELVTLRHEAFDRSLYAEGALAAARFLLKKPAGLYGAGDLFSEKKT